LATIKRLSPLTEKGSVAGSRLLEAETAAREARSQVLRAQQSLVNLGLPIDADPFQGRSADDVAADLQFLGLPEAFATNLDRKSTTSNLLPIRAPFDGILVERDVVAGEVVDTGILLLTVADTTQMWLTLDVPSEEADYVVLDQRVHFQTSGTSGDVTGRIAWISTEADPQTRTVKVRAVLDNPDGRLRNETFGTGRIVLRSEADAIVVPSESVQWDGSCQVVFVRDKDFFASDQSPKLFYPRPVRVGARTDESVEILAGLLPGEVVVTKGAGVLRGELLKNNLGAG
jgi:RND family efflux transporter MFP subunit